MSRSLIVATISALLPLAVNAQQCPPGRTARPTLGVGTFHCRGGSCRVPGASAEMVSGLSGSGGLSGALLRRRAQQGTQTQYRFTVEPVLSNIRAGGPSQGLIMEGDVLVAVNDVPVTSEHAGHTLSTMVVGQPVTLTLRRGGEYTSVDVTPVLSCAGTEVSTGLGAQPPRRDRTEDPVPRLPASLGMTRVPSRGLVLYGAKEVELLPDGSSRWFYVELPIVVEARPGLSTPDLLVGDVLLSVDGKPLDTAAGTEAFLRALTQGGRFEVRRGDRILTTPIVWKQAR